MVLNRQRAEKIDLAGARRFASSAERALGISRRGFNVCLVDDREIARLNETYRGKASPTDVLSFAWAPAGEPAFAGDPESPGSREFRGFLGDIVISVESAGRNAAVEGHSTDAEIRWLILHGLLHLIGMDHETDGGEMKALELQLRTKLGLDGAAALPARRPAAEPRSIAPAQRPTRGAARSTASGSPGTRPKKRRG